MADLITLAEYKTAIGESGTEHDARFNLAIQAASAAIRTWTDRDFGADSVTEDRTFRYAGRGWLDIDDCSEVNSVTLMGGIIPSTTYLVQPQTPPYTWIELPTYDTLSGEMGFTYNLDTFLRRLTQPRTLECIVNADWGYTPVPADVKQAAIWTTAAMAQSPDTAGQITGESVAEVNRSYAVAQLTKQESIPARAQEILDQYRRVVV
jgi:hypothetical protein